MMGMDSDMQRILRAGCGLALTLAFAAPALASYGIYVGSGLTADGSVLLGGTGEEVSSHWLEIVPAGTHPEGATISVGVDGRATYPGEFIEIPQVPQTAKYITMNYTDYEGFPPPLTNGGLNEHGVAARDIWAPSRPELAAMTPEPQRGPNYSDLSRIAMERATSAREAVTIIGGLMDEYGYSTYGGNSHLFADANEGWVVLNFAGGQGLWIAQRLGSDEVRMSYPGYIHEVPVDFREREGWMGSANFISFAVDQGWWDPDSGEPFDANAVYGNGEGRSEGVRIIEARLRQQAMEGGVTLRQMMNAVRDPLISSDAAGYGQVAHIRQQDPHPELKMLWVAPTGSVTAPFVPYWIAGSEVLPEFGKHRYLTKGQASTFVRPDFAVQEASRFAGRLFKRLMYYTCDAPARFLPEVTEALTAFEDQSIEQAGAIESRSLVLFNAGEPAMARAVIDDYSSARARAALALGDALLGSIEARHRLLEGTEVPADAREMGTRYGPYVNCRVE
ncbi:dipeptidase [Chromatocurvus halotolerans]|uniref:Dipeptidase n=2 Tax=Chromatocurvus halotolerans TaxID=1132028 RepID=A0A4R2KM21_9GAMM|nr:dipeptidase [Chromatocurvus halotolerans]